MPVSVPEKTLEHWSSQYLAYRYRSKAALWWPATGQDLDVAWLPRRPGKAVQLELKTTTVAGTGLHDVNVDLGQLWEYQHRGLSRQPFYVFPRPDWNGELKSAAKAHGLPVTELAFRRSGSAWFAEWMVALTTAQVANVLATNLAAHGSPDRGKRARLVRFDLSDPVRGLITTWGAGKVKQPIFVHWRDFWNALQQCGQPGWPQLIRIPADLAAWTSQTRYTANEVLAMLRYADSQARGDDEFVDLEPDADGGFRIGSSPKLDASRDLVSPELDPGTEDHRQVVFLDARALRSASR